MSSLPGDDGLVGEDPPPGRQPMAGDPAVWDG
jgi:hypothetical protein